MHELHEINSMRMVYFIIELNGYQKMQRERAKRTLFNVTQSIQLSTIAKQSEEKNNRTLWRSLTTTNKRENSINVNRYSISMHFRVVFFLRAKWNMAFVILIAMKVENVWHYFFFSINFRHPENANSKSFLFCELIYFNNNNKCFEVDRIEFIVIKRFHWNKWVDPWWR